MLIANSVLAMAKYETESVTGLGKLKVSTQYLCRLIIHCLTGYSNILYIIIISSFIYRLIHKYGLNVIAY